MKTISVLTQKGGVGKTTTAIHIAGYLAAQNNNVLLIDFDNQCNLTTGFGLDEFAGVNIFSFLQGNNDCVKKSERISVVKGDINLSASMLQRYALKNAINKLEEYDWVIIDCPPAGINDTLSLGEIALCASDYVISPAEADIYSINGIINLIGGISKIKKSYNPNLTFLGIFINKAMVNTKAFLNYYNQLKTMLPPSYFFNSYVRQDSIVMKAKEKGTTIFNLNEKSRAAENLRSLCNEMIQKINLKESIKDAK